MLNRIYNFIDDNEFRIPLYDDKIHFINFKKIISLENNYISLTGKNKKIVITGNNLLLNKLLKDEMLISGTINKIEVYDAR